MHIQALIGLAGGAGCIFGTTFFGGANCRAAAIMRRCFCNAAVLQRSCGGAFAMLP